MTGHELVKYVAPFNGVARQRPGLAVCSCTATLEDQGLTKTIARRWMREHPHRKDSGARDLPMGEDAPGRSSLQAVAEFDFGLVEDAATSVQLRLWGARVVDGDATTVANEISSMARRMREAIATHVFSDVQLFELRHVPHALGKVLASIDPERAR